MVQIARPDSTITAGQWTVAGSSPAPTLHESIDEVTSDDVVTSIKTPTPPNDTHGEIGLSNVTDPGVNTGHIMRVRTISNDIGTNQFEIKLMQGSTTIVTWTFAPAAGFVWGTQTRELSEAEAAQITDYPGLTFRPDARKLSGGNGQANISWFEFEVPDAGPGATDLVIQDASHGHSTDGVAFTQEHALAVQDASHAHSVDAVALSQLHILAVADSVHAHTAEAPALTQFHILTIQDASHAHAADVVVLVVNQVGNPDVIVGWRLRRQAKTGHLLRRSATVGHK